MNGIYNNKLLKKYILSHRQTIISISEGVTIDAQQPRELTIKQDLRVGSAKNEENRLISGNATADDDFSYYNLEKFSNSSHIKLFTFVNLRNSTKTPFYSCHNNGNTTLDVESLPSHEITFTYSVEYDKTQLTQDVMIAVVENKMTSTVANFLLHCGYDSSSLSDSTLSIARLRTSDTAMVQDNIATNNTGINVVFPSPNDYLSGT
jgi:hypothetical protein